MLQHFAKTIATLCLPSALLVSVSVSGCERVTATSNNSSTAPTVQTAAQAKQSVAIKSNGHHKSASATSKIEAKPTKAVLYFDPNKWKQTESPEGGQIEFTHKTGDGYGLIIAERIALSPDALRKIALANAKEVAPDARIVDEEKRIVNGREVIQMRMRATVEGLSIEYRGYYFTGKEGTIQVLTYTTENLVGEYQQDFEEFLNGFSVGG